MNKRLFLITALMLLMISICAVSAEDVNQSDDNLMIYDSDVISAGESTVGSFADLSKDVDDSTVELDIKSDYKFNSSTDEDFTEGIGIVVSEEGIYTINGNNHVIDADNQAGVFRFTNGTVHINNLKITNANRHSIILYNCELQTNNVTFENNQDLRSGGAIYAEESNYYSYNDRFINNYANYGASIFSLNSIIKIDNSTFINNKTINWSLIYGYNSIMTVSNSIFANVTSKYATAIYSEKNKLTVLNSQFINLYANATAGAIGCKATDSLTIEGCSFINVASAKNAGAVYADLNGVNIHSKNAATITNSLFENCSSNFAGAYLQLGGILNLMTTEFTNNIAEYAGGAVYLSNTTVLIGNSKFNKNIANQLYGGAVYIDDSNSIIATCNFMDNNAGTFGDAIYLHDSKYEIKNSKFSKGLNEAIVSFFDRKGSTLSNNELNGGKTLLNQIAYNTILEYEGKQIILNVTSTSNATVNDARFDLRDYKVIGTNLSLAGVVKDQGSKGACWAFGATGALESAFLKATGILLDLSENNIQGTLIHYNEYGASDIYEGGYTTSAMGLFISWLGVISTEFDSYDELGKISIASFVPGESYHIQDAVIIPERKNALDNDKLKEALIEYGGLTVHLYGASSNNEYYNPDTHAQYYNGEGSGNHIVTLVGWDDNYSKDNFNIKPQGDGAWICKNSWGTDWGEDGYFYVSYYDTTFSTDTTSVGYIINNIENYNGLYQYDIGAFDRFLHDKGEIINFVNTYNAYDYELIKAVGTYFDEVGQPYTVNIYVDGAVVYTQTGKSTHAGFETIKLDKQISIDEGQQFSVGIQTDSMPLLEDTRIHFESGKSMAYFADESVYDLGIRGKTACIKAYTVVNPNHEEDKSQYYTKNANLTLYSNAGGKTISVYKEGKKLGSATVKDGKASFNFSLETGKYSAITSYDDGDIVEGFEIKNTIEVADSVKIGYNTILNIDAQFYDENGVELFYRNVTFKVDGKTYTGTIDNNEGMLHLTLSDMSIGKHTVILQNPVTLEESVTTIQVVSRFSGNSNVDMFYADGSSFKVRAYDNYGEPVGANQIVTIKLNKATYNVKTNSNGYAILKIPDTVKPGTYALTATYAGQTIKNTVKVKQVLKLAKVTVKKSAKKLLIKATLKGKTIIKGKTLTFKFNGKTYAAKTDKKGIAKITINKSVLNKLKVGKKVTYQVTYLKNTVKQTVKVKK